MDEKPIQGLHHIPLCEAAKAQQLAPVAEIASKWLGRVAKKDTPQEKGEFNHPGAFALFFIRSFSLWDNKLPANFSCKAAPRFTCFFKCKKWKKGDALPAFRKAAETGLVAVPNPCNEVIYLKKKKKRLKDSSEVRRMSVSLQGTSHEIPKSNKEVLVLYFFFPYTWWNGDAMECNTDADVDISSFCPANTVSHYPSSVKGRAFHAQLVFFRASCPFRHFTQVSDSRLSFIGSLPFMMVELTRRITWVVPF